MSPADVLLLSESTRKVPLFPLSSLQNISRILCGVWKQATYREHTFLYTCQSLRMAVEDLVALLVAGEAHGTAQSNWLLYLKLPINFRFSEITLRRPKGESVDARKRTAVVSMKLSSCEHSGASAAEGHETP
jgi:hypothetical protein